MNLKIPYAYSPFIENLDYYKTTAATSVTNSNHKDLTGLSNGGNLQHHTKIKLN